MTRSRPSSPRQWSDVELNKTSDKSRRETLAKQIFRDEPPLSLSPHDRTARAARRIIESETSRREELSARLREARLKKEALEDEDPADTPEPGDPRDTN